MILSRTHFRWAVATFVVVGVTAVLWYTVSQALGQQQPGSNCIPFGSVSNDAVIRSNTGQATLASAISALQADCAENGLATPTGRRVQIYRLGGCRFMTDEQKEKLRSDHADRLMQVGNGKDYETIVLDCNPRWGH